MMMHVYRTILSLFIYGLPTYAISAGNTDLGEGFLNAITYGAPVVSSPALCSIAGNDATPAIQAALNSLDVSKGGIVYLPSGQYCLKGHLTVPSSTGLRGVFNAPQALPNAVAPTRGTVLLAYEGEGLPNGSPLISMGVSSTVEGVSIQYPSQAAPSGNGWVPKQYPYAIEGNVGVTIQNVYLWNAYQGIDMTAAPTGGQFIIRGIYGQPISVGIMFDKIYDVGRLEDIHFWPFWNYGAVAWTETNGSAFVFGRVDNINGSNIFVWGYRDGMLFQTTPAGNASGQFTNVLLDKCVVGLHLRGSFLAGLTFANININTDKANPGLLPAYGVWSESNEGAAQNSYLSLTNAHFFGTYVNAIRWEGGNHLLVSNSKFGQFDGTNAAIVMTRGSAIIEGNMFYGAVLGTPALSIGSSIGRTLFMGNSLFGATAVSGSSPWLVQANNGP